MGVNEFIVLHSLIILTIIPIEEHYPVSLRSNGHLTSFNYGSFSRTSGRMRWYRVTNLTLSGGFTFSDAVGSLKHSCVYLHMKIWHVFQRRYSRVILRVTRFSRAPLNMLVPVKYYKWHRKTHCDATTTHLEIPFLYPPVSSINEKRYLLPDYITIEGEEERIIIRNDYRALRYLLQMWDLVMIFFLSHLDDRVTRVSHASATFFRFAACKSFFSRKLGAYSGRWVTRRILHARIYRKTTRFTYLRVPRT